MAFDSVGNLYALQYANQPEWQGVRDGSLIQIAPDGTRTTVISGNGLEAATALSVGLDGAIYVSNRGDLPGQGQVLRIDIKKTVPEPTFILGILTFAALGINSFSQRQRSHEV